MWFGLFSLCIMLKVNRFKLPFFDVVPDGIILNRFTSDISTVDSSIQGQLSTTSIMSLNLLSLIIVNSIQLKYIVFLFIVFRKYHPFIQIYYTNNLYLITCISVAMFVGCLRLYISLSRQLRRLVCPLFLVSYIYLTFPKISVSRSHVFSVFSQSLEGHLIIKTYGRIKMFQQVALSNFDRVQRVEFSEVSARRW